jgi:hypothetical protein
VCVGGSFVFICFYENVFWVVVVWCVEKAGACAIQLKKMWTRPVHVRGK